MKKIIYIIILLLFIFNSNSKAQITLTSANNPSIGDFAKYVRCDTIGILPGDSGTNQNWNFNNIIQLDSFTQYYINPANTPHFSNFPQSNIAYGVNYILDFLAYSRTSNNQYEYLGYTYGNQITIFSNTMIQMHYPFTYNSLFNDSYSGTESSNGFFITGSINLTGDAAGTISLPSGTFNNSLRIKTITIETDSSINSIIFIKSIVYDWYVNTFKFPIFSIIYSENVQNGDTTKHKEIHFCRGQSIGIKPISNEIPNSFSLSQNYPNPFNPSTKIKFDIAKPSYTKLIVYDILGREVTTLVNEQLKPGSYEVEWNAGNYSSGVYFYTMKTESFNQTKRMVLVK